MDGLRFTRVLPLFVTILVLASAAAPVLGQQIQAGDHIPARIDTPWNYKGVSDSRFAVTWTYELWHPDATYIAIHFTDFDLAPGDYLIVSDASGRQSYTLQGRGKMNAGTFWARHLKGDTAVLELVQVTPEGGQGFRIDEYVAGFRNIGVGSRAICGTDDKENAICYETSHPTEYDRGRAVCRLLSNGSGFCTGWLVSGSNHVMTNEHCVTSASDALNTDFDFMGEAPTCETPNCDDCYQGTIFSGATFIQDNADLDYCLMQINNGDPASSFGYLEIDDRVAVVGEEIYIVGHPGGRAKEMTIYSTHASDPGGVPLVYSITEPPCSGSGYYDVGYYADTEGGSSGSPVLARSSHKVIALHHCANCPNRGVPIHLIYPEIEAYLYPGPTGVIALDKGKYGCDDLVAMQLKDGDIGGNGTQDVVVTTTGGDSETVALTETGADTAIFEGSIVTEAAAVATEDGMLQVADGETITVTYIDADDGQGGTNVPATDDAVADCAPPQILDVQTTTIEPRAATVTIDADEPVRGTVHYGLSCGALTGSATGSGYANPADVNITGLDDDTTYFYVVEAEDEAGNLSYDDNGGVCYTFTTPEIPDFFTELFSSGSNDLDDVSLIFTPNGSNDFYEGCAEPITALPTDPTGGTTLSLSDDGNTAINFTGTVYLYGVGYTTAYVGANGYVTFTAGDGAYDESLADHFDLPRISALFDDLDPAQGGTLSWLELADRVAVTWEAVPEHNGSTENTFQIEMFFDGKIVISYLTVEATDGLAGISEGAGVSPDYYPTDLSELGPCGPKPPAAEDVQVTTPESTPVDVTLVASDDGEPDPPGALEYVITSLPLHGSLSDPNAGAIDTVPYTLASYGALVTYSPEQYYNGADAFQYVANDGGTPPNGGDSDPANVFLEVGGPQAVHVFPAGYRSGLEC